jgi:hypothetical protein
MRDKDNLLRGACSVCTACVEYCFRRDSNRCEDCGCLVTRHDVLPDGADDPLAALPMSPRSLRSQSPAAAQAVALLPKAYAGGYNSYPWSNPATFYAQLPQSHYMPGFDAGMQLLESQKNAAAVASGKFSLCFLFFFFFAVSTRRFSCSCLWHREAILLGRI